MKTALLYILLFAASCLPLFGVESKDDAKPTRRMITPDVVTVPLDDYCKQAGLAQKKYGEGKICVVVIGQADIANEAKIMVETGEKTLLMLDQWTGQTGIFNGPKENPKHVYHLILFAKDQDYLGFVDFLREKKILGAPDGRDDLIKQLLNFRGPLSLVIVTRNAVLRPDNFAVHSVTCQAISAFFFERGDIDPPAWVTEGLSAEIQRLLCHGEVLWSSISYEMSSPDMKGNWALDVAFMIKKNDTNLRKASHVMQFELQSLPGAHYKLMWSFSKMLVQTAGGKKGDKNKFYMMLEELAKGVKSEEAVKKVFGIADPQLTQAWFGWAVNQR